MGRLKPAPNLFGAGQVWGRFKPGLGHCPPQTCKPWPCCSLINIVCAGIVSGALLQLEEEFGLSCQQEELVVSALLIGALVASLVGGEIHWWLSLNSCWFILVTGSKCNPPPFPQQCKDMENTKVYIINVEIVTYWYLCNLIYDLTLVFDNKYNMSLVVNTEQPKTRFRSSKISSLQVWMVIQEVWGS